MSDEEKKPALETPESEVTETPESKDIKYRRSPVNLTEDDERLALIMARAISLLGRDVEDEDDPLIDAVVDIRRRMHREGDTGNLSVDDREELIAQAFDHSFNVNTHYNEAIDRGGWSSQIKHTSGRALQIGQRNNATLTGKELKGDDASLWVSSALGSGGKRLVPLPATGITVLLSPPSIMDLANTATRLVELRDEFGVEQKTFAFGNSSVYLRDHLVDFVLEHISDASLEDRSINNLRKTILLADYPTLLAGFASTMWPDKYPIVVPCTNELDKCDHIITGDINLREMVIYDDASLTDEQKATLLDVRRRLSNEEVKAYQAKHTRGHTHEFTLGDEDMDDVSIRITLERPSLHTHIEMGRQWVAAVNRVVREQSEGRSEQDKELIRNIVRTRTIAREHGHHVSKITIIDAEGNEGYITGRGEISKSLDTLSGRDGYLAKFMEELNKYLIDTTISVVGLPAIECPKCKKRLKGSDEPYIFNGNVPTKDFLPLDVETIFFSLALQKISREI